MGQKYSMEEYERDRGGFCRMLTSYNPEHNPTYIDEGNREMFVVEQKDDEGNVDQLHLSPNQAFEMRQKLDKFLELHFGKQQPAPAFVVPSADLLSTAA